MEYETDSGGLSVDTNQSHEKAIVTLTRSRTFQLQGVQYCVGTRMCEG